MTGAIRILLLADSHLGFDLPAHPRVERRRRGHDFLANYQAALAPALAGDVDLVVHGGDVFDRPAVLPSIAYQAFEPLRRVAERGIPVFVVPGNHERSRLPHRHLASHPLLHIFDHPRTFVTEVRGARIALSGFPYERREARTRFTSLLEACAWRQVPADARVLCMHHCVEGATVGPTNYMFTTAADVIRLEDVPGEFAAVLAGHIHRHQALTTDRSGRALRVPVLYPGSIERTALAERDEAKGYMMVQLDIAGDRGASWEFRQLPARPMVRAEVAAEGLDEGSLAAAIRAIVNQVPPDAVVAIRVTGALTGAQWRQLSASRLRTFVPATMNVEILPDRDVAVGLADRRASRPKEVTSAPSQLSFTDQVDVPA